MSSDMKLISKKSRILHQLSKLSLLAPKKYLNWPERVRQCCSRSSLDRRSPAKLTGFQNAIYPWNPSNLEWLRCFFQRGENSTSRGFNTPSVCSVYIRFLGWCIHCSGTNWILIHWVYFSLVFGSWHQRNQIERNLIDQ